MSNIERQQRNTEYVSAAARENLLAGFGAGVLAFVLGFAWAGYSETLLTIALCVAGGFFGFLCMVRFSLDEFKAYYDQENSERTVAGLLAEVDALRKELKHTKVQLRTQEHNDASKLARDMVAPDKHAELRRHVSIIIDRWAAGGSYSRDHCDGMSKVQWRAATQFLLDAGVMVLGGPGNRQRVFVDGLKLSQVERAVSERFERLEKFENTTFVVA